MAIRDTLLQAFQKFRQGPVVKENDRANLPNGGHTGYYPPVQPKPSKQQRQQAPGQTQNTSQINYDPNFYQSAGFQQNYQGNNTAFQQVRGQQTAYNAASPFGSQTGYAPAGSPAHTWQQPMTTNSLQAQQPTQGTTASQPQNESQGAQPYPTDGNVTYAFGQQFRDQNGVAYAHVERLAQPLSVATCFRLIEFMRNGESIIVNLELIHDENERTRCLDMLCGAAFTMQCTFNRVADLCIYLIAPNTVQVLPYESIRQLSEEDQNLRWPQEEGAIRTDLRWNGRRSSRTASPNMQEPRYRYSR